MAIEFALDEFPKEIALKGGLSSTIRPLEEGDEKVLHEFFLGIPKRELMFLKHRVTDAGVIRGWCRDIDPSHKCPLVAMNDGKILGTATLHQDLGGWKCHIGRVSVLIHPDFRSKGLARALVSELIEIARHCGLEEVSAEFIGEQEGAMRTFALLGFSHLCRLEKYVKDIEARRHDWVLMGLRLTTPEEYASAG